MNIFWHELRYRLKSTLLWAVALIFFMIVSMVKYETITADGGAAIQMMLTTFPQTVQAVFGMSGLDLTTVAGYFGVCFLLMAVLLSVHAGLTGARILADEEVDKTTEFLYVKPRSRSQIITAKLLAGGVVVIAVWLASVLGSVIGIAKFASFDNFTHDFWQLMWGALCIQILFLMVGAAVAAIGRRAQTAGKWLTIIIFTSYLLYILTKLSTSFDWLRFVSVFRWFDAVTILSQHSLDVLGVGLSAFVSVTACALVDWYYGRRDLHI